MQGHVEGPDIDSELQRVRGAHPQKLPREERALYAPPLNGGVARPVGGERVPETAVHFAQDLARVLKDELDHLSRFAERQRPKTVLHRLGQKEADLHDWAGALVKRPGFLLAPDTTLGFLEASAAAQPAQRAPLLCAVQGRVPQHERFLPPRAAVPGDDAPGLTPDPRQLGGVLVGVGNRRTADDELRLDPELALAQAPQAPQNEAHVATEHARVRVGLVQHDKPES